MFSGCTWSRAISSSFILSLLMIRYFSSTPMKSLTQRPYFLGIAISFLALTPSWNYNFGFANSFFVSIWFSGNSSLIWAKIETSISNRLCTFNRSSWFEAWVFWFNFEKKSWFFFWFFNFIASRVVPSSIFYGNLRWFIFEVKIFGYVPDNGEFSPV